MKKYICVVMVILIILPLFNSTPSFGSIRSRDVLSIKMIAVAVGDDFSFAIDADGNLWAWGENGSSRLGDGTFTVREIMDDDGSWHRQWRIVDDNNRHIPIKIMDSVVSVSAGSSHAMAIRSDGSLWAWGSNIFGQLGDGTAETRRYPIKIMDSVAYVSTRGSHTMAIKTDGSLWAWGGNRDGQLGDGTTESRRSPVKVMDSVVYVSAGRNHTMAIRTDGSLWAWGWNAEGQLGDGTRNCTTEARPNPVKIMDSVASVSAGLYHTLAIKTDGSLWAWGSNWRGQIGDGTYSTHDENRNIIDNSRHSPVKVMDSVMAASAGNSHTMAITTDGNLWAWGSNEHGRIGNGISTRSRPGIIQYPIIILESVAAVSTFNHTLALKTDGSVWAWGSNSSGQLGDGTTKFRLFPIKVQTNPLGEWEDF
ncbi:MAG: hypothetical protein FWC91_07740 [Defluviitaleaceae bacterium]|nr:hypothetical protein [Defluviitaleaceae bacterium]